MNFSHTVYEEEEGEADEAPLGCCRQEALLVERLSDLCLQDERPQGRLLGAGHGAGHLGGGGR